MEIMKIVVPVILLLINTCLAVENATTKLEQQSNVQKREKQYLIEDDPNEGPEQKRDERQSTPPKSNRNLDAKGNSRIINIRMQPPPNILTTPKPTMKLGPQRIPTKIPVILKSAKVVPGPAHAIRMKMLENRINETMCNSNKDNTVTLNIAPPMETKDSIPYFTIEDKTARRSEIICNPNSVDNRNLDIKSNETLKKDGKETSGNNGVNSQTKENNTQNEGKKGQVISNSERKVVAQKQVHFFEDEPEPLPSSFRRRQKCENDASQGLGVSPNKVKEMPIERKGTNKPKKEETRKKINEHDDDNDPDIVKMSNGTHLISIKKIRNHDKYQIRRDGEEITVPTEERIINLPPPEPMNEKRSDEPEKHSFTKESITGKQQSQDITGHAFRETKDKEEKGTKNCISQHKHEEIEDKTQFLPAITLQPIGPPTVLNQGNQECWNYLQNPYYNPYYQHYYDQYKKNYGMVQSTPNIYGQGIIEPRIYGEQMNPFILSQATIEPYAPEGTTPYYSSPVIGPDSTQYSYNAYGNQQGIDNAPRPQRQEVRPENTSGKDWNINKDVEIRMRNGLSSTDVPDIDIRRDFDENIDDAKVGSGIGKVNPYAASTMPININGALVYPYMNQGYRYMC